MRKYLRGGPPEASSAEPLAKEYGFRDIDGRRPDWGTHIDRATAAIVERGGPADAAERFLLHMRSFQLELDPTRAEEAKRIAAILADSKKRAPKKKTKKKK